MSLELLLCSLRNDVSVQRLGQHMNELLSFLEEPPLGLTICTRTVEPCEVSRIAEVSDFDSLCDLSEQIVAILAPVYHHSRSIILCEPLHPFAVSARAGLPHAEWGVRKGVIAFVYGTIDKYVIWHEALHVLGAGDCYDTADPEGNPGPSCELSNCIMQYEPTKERVGNWPFLCQENLARILAQTHNG